jgi:hypothetical protein
MTQIGTKIAVQLAASKSLLGIENNAKGMHY